MATENVELIAAYFTLAGDVYPFGPTQISPFPFRERVEAGIVGVNVGVAQPFAFFPFSGWKGSFYGDLHLQGTDGVDFYTRKKMVVTRW